MPQLHFSHSQLPNTLATNTGMDEISWGYQLNTQTYPTYGGEVVQILSAYTDNIRVGGTVRSYKKMEEIYAWFLAYMQIATQGGEGVSYTQEPVTMIYSKRGWQWKIHPLSLPGFKYGRDVVAPTWIMEAHVYDDDARIRALNLEAAQRGLERVTPGIGFREDNPFSDPHAKRKDFKIEDLEEYYNNAADYFNTLIPAYLKGDYESFLGEIGSKPAFFGGKDQGDTKEESKSKERNRNR